MVYLGFVDYNTTFLAPLPRIPKLVSLKDVWLLEDLLVIGSLLYLLLSKFMLI